MPAVSVNGASLSDHTEALSAMLACATQRNWRGEAMDPTRLAKVYPEGALRVQAGPPITPTLPEDVVESEFHAFAADTELEMNDAGLTEFLAHLGVKLPPGVKPRAVLERHFGGQDHEC